MARPERNNIDYFPHSVSHGKKMHYLREKFNNDGYAVWFMLLEELGRADYHYLNLSDDVTLMYLSSQFKVTENLLQEIIKALVKMGDFDAELWADNLILFNAKFVASIEDAYSKRRNSCVDKNSLLLHLEGLGIRKPSKSTRKPSKSLLEVPVNPQSKVEESKVDKDLNFKALFDTARKLYQGSKNGLEPEWTNFKKKNPVKLSSDILVAVKYQIAWRDELKNSNTFVAPWKNFSTWINKQCWTEEKPQAESTTQKQTHSTIMV